MRKAGCLDGTCYSGKCNLMVVVSKRTGPELVAAKALYRAVPAWGGLRGGRDLTPLFEMIEKGGLYLAEGKYKFKTPPLPARITFDESVRGAGLEHCTESHTMRTHRSESHACVSCSPRWSALPC